MKTLNHAVIDEEQMKLLNYLQRQTGDSSFFTFDVNVIQQIEIEKSIVVSQNDMENLKIVREEERKKKEEEGEEEEEGGRGRRRGRKRRCASPNNEFK